VIFTPIVKMALSKIIGHPFKLLVYKKKRTAIVGSSEEINRVKNLLNESNQEFDNLFYVSPTTNRQLGFGFCANINQLNEASKIFKFDEIIFCSANITAQEIINTMQQLSFLNLEFKIAPSNASYIIGSNSINTTGQYYSLLSNNNILTIQNLRNKKMFDVIFSLLVVVLFPLFFVLNGFKFIVFKNAFLILAGKLSWVGYDLTGTN